MRSFRIFAVGSAALAYALAVLGSWVRINEAGMACPDWPLCHGVLIPTFTGGVIWEWLHRLVALVEGVMLVGVLITGWRVRNRIAGVVPTLIALVVIFGVQVGVGGATVRLGNSPISVVIHWGTAMALLATLTALAVLSILAPTAGTQFRSREGSTARLLGFAAFCAFGTMCLGAYVSSSRAGLACPTFPTCDGTLLGSSALQLAQMLHRIAAFVFFGIGAYATWYAVRIEGPAVRTFAELGLLLAAIQIGLGIANVLWMMPIVLREAHAANAGLTFLAYVIAAVVAALAPASEASLRDRGRAPQYTRASGG